MKVIGWISYEEAEQYESVLPGLGGFFSRGMRWPEFIAAWSPQYVPYYEALREAVLERGLRYNGGMHQSAVDGTPVFSDGTVGLFSFRAWGDLMAAIWSSAEDEDYHYMDFY